MRAVKCVVGSYGAVMDDTECNAATRPTDTQVTDRGLYPSLKPIHCEEAGSCAVTPETDTGRYCMLKSDDSC